MGHAQASMVRVLRTPELDVEPELVLEEVCPDEVEPVELEPVELLLEVEPGLRAKKAAPAAMTIKTTMITTMREVPTPGLLSR
jgi:hypothetical protein